MFGGGNARAGATTDDGQASSHLGAQAFQDGLASVVVIFHFSFNRYANSALKSAGGSTAARLSGINERVVGVCLAMSVLGMVVSLPARSAKTIAWPASRRLRPRRVWLFFSLIIE